MDLSKTDCKICIALSACGQSHFFNTLLQETANFAHIPALDPTILGHTLVVSKRHFASLSEMEYQDIEEVQNFLHELLASKNIADYLLFEHGGSNQDKGGACVLHMHIHILPRLSSYYNVLDDVLPFIEIKSLKSIRSIQYPYIMSFNKSGLIRVYTAYNVHSRMMLKAIGAQNDDVGYSLEMKNVDLIKQCIQYWKT